MVKCQKLLLFGLTLICLLLNVQQQVFADYTNQNFDSWTEQTSWGTYTNTDEWIMFGGKIMGTTRWPDPRSEPHSGWLADADTDTNSYLRTPRFTNGVGTITYYCLNKDYGGENVFSIQYSTDAASWITAATATNTSSADWIGFNSVIDVFDSVYVRFRKISDTGATEQCLGLDDIVVGSAPGVSFSDLTTDPVSPTLNDEVYICVNARTNPAAANIVMNAIYWLAGSEYYNSVSLVHVSNDLYRSSSPVPAGYEGIVYYYVQATYSGLSSSSVLYPYGGNANPASYESTWAYSAFSGYTNQNFDSWTNVFQWGTRINSDGWIMFNGKIWNTKRWPDPYSIDHSGWLMDADNCTNSHLRTPRFTNGIGTITYYCRNRGEGESVFSIQHSTNAKNWINGATVTNNSYDWVCLTNILDVFESSYIRFLKISDTGVYDQILGLDNISAGSAPGVSFSNLTIDPESPVASNEVYIYVNARTNPAASDIVMTAKYRLGDVGSYISVGLVMVSNDLYCMSSPVSTGYEGTVYYYVQATYSGLDSSSVLYPYDGSNNPASYAVGTDLPFIDFLSSDTTVDNFITTMNISGTNNPNVVGTMRWTNSLTLGGGTFAAQTWWLILSAPLNVGTNVITVYGTNVFGTVASDSIAIIRCPSEKTLTVVSAQGGASPGTLTTNYNTTLSQFVTNSPVASGAGVRQVCTGGAVTGNSYTQVNSTNVVLTLTNSATLTWTWQTQYLITVQTTGSGTIIGSGGWFDAGGITVLGAVASSNWSFTGWSGNTNGCIIAGEVITIPMTQARTITAIFSEITRPRTAAADFDGDGRSDYGCYDAAGIPGAVNPGQWYFMKSTDGFDASVRFGYAGTVPVVGDFDGDGRSDYGCYDAAGIPGAVNPGQWYFMKSTDGFDASVSFGYAGTVPVVGDFDGDGTDDYGCYDAAGNYGQPPGSWYFMMSTRGFTTKTFGYAGTVPVVGDFDGDGTNDYGCYDAAGIPGLVNPGQWYFMKSSEGFDASVSFGYA